MMTHDDDTTGVSLDQFVAEPLIPASLNLPPDGPAWECDAPAGFDPGRLIGRQVLDSSGRVVGWVRAAGETTEGLTLTIAIPAAPDAGDQT
jgi:hypothetical protein